MQRGYGDTDRPLVRDLWDADSHGKTVPMLEMGNHEPDRRNVDFTRYYDPAYAALELEKVWKRAWLYACRDEDLPNVGDRLRFNVGPLSYIVVRSGKDEFKAFYNSCLHRGTALCSSHGTESGDVIRCPYHHWEWNINGTLRKIPNHWDFTGIDRRNASLREVKVGRWGGFVYINADPNAAPFEEALGPIPRHFESMAMADRYTAGRFRKLVPANWKLCVEAFMESYHLIGTHPSAIPFTGESQAQYEIFAGENGNVGRYVTPAGIPSMNAGADATALAASEMFAAALKAWRFPDAEMPKLDPSKDTRVQIAQWHRDLHERLYKTSTAGTPDSVMIDNSLYFVFPQSTLWLGEAIPFAYQFTPHATDPEKCYLDCRLLLRYPADQPRPPAAPVVEVGLDQTILDRAKDFGFLATVFDEDMDNLPRVQAGVRAADPARHHSYLASYQELLIQHLHDVLDAWIARP